MIAIPFPYNTEKEELKSSYLSFLVRVFVIKGQEFFDVKIRKQVFIKEMKKLGWNKKRINQTWKNGKEGVFIKKITPEYLILQGKEKVVGEKGFLTRVEGDFDIGFYRYCRIITKINAEKPVEQTKEFYFKFKTKKSKLYNKEIINRSLGEKKGRGLRRIAESVGCSPKTVANRLKKCESEGEIKIVKRFDSYNGFRIRKTNLYFPLKDIVFYRYYNKNNTTLKRKLTLKSAISSLISEKTIILNGALSKNNLYSNNYEIIDKLKLCS